MSSTLLHSALAIGGIVVGISATLAITSSTNNSKKDSSSSSTSSSSSPLGISRPSINGAVPSRNGDLSGGGVIQRQIGPIADFLQRTAYVTAYDRARRIPAWTAEHLTAESLKRIPTSNEAGSGGGGGGGGGGNRQNSRFKEDEDVPIMFRARLLDYLKSGYDRGHMVPAADAKSSQQAMDETFLLSNVAPQVGDGFNRHYWAYLEAFCRTLTNSFSDVYVFTVPLFLPRQSPDGKWYVSYEMIAPQNSAPSIAVPTHFAKVIMASRDKSTGGKGLGGLVKSGTIGEKEWSIGAFVLPNDVIDEKTPLTNFVVPIEAVESSAGLSLLPDDMKSISRPLCQRIPCQLVIRRFDDAQKGGKGGNNNNKQRNRSATA